MGVAGMAKSFALLFHTFLGCDGCGEMSFALFFHIFGGMVK